jgi:DNA-binding GntR family transcriptional regulator
MKTKSEIAYIKIREMIISGEINKNSHISLQVMARKLGVSKSPVRDAFQRLQNDGLVNIFPTQGIFIRDLSFDEAINIYDVRIALESYVLERVFPSIKEEDIKKLRKILEYQKISLDENDAYKFMKYDEEQHLYFFELYSNIIFLEIFNSLRTRIFRAGIQALMSGAMFDTYKDHLAIVDSLEKRNLNKTIENLKQHLRRGLNVCTKISN